MDKNQNPSANNEDLNQSSNQEPNKQSEVESSYAEMVKAKEAADERYKEHVNNLEDMLNLVSSEFTEINKDLFIQIEREIDIVVLMDKDGIELTVTQQQLADAIKKANEENNSFFEFEFAAINKPDNNGRNLGKNVKIERDRIGMTVEMFSASEMSKAARCQKVLQELENAKRNRETGDALAKFAKNLKDAITNKKS